MHRQHLAPLQIRYERWDINLQNVFFSGLRSPLLYHLVASHGNVYKHFVVSCLGEEVVNAASVINVNKGPNVHSIKTRSFAQIKYSQPASLRCGLSCRMLI